MILTWSVSNCFVLFDLILYVTVNNFSVMSGRVFLWVEPVLTKDSPTVLDTLIAFLIFFKKKVDFEKKSAEDKNNEKFPSM